jgi:hypothetical protein
MAVTFTTCRPGVASRAEPFPVVPVQESRPEPPVSVQPNSASTWSPSVYAVAGSGEVTVTAGTTASGAGPIAAR